MKNALYKSDYSAPNGRIIGKQANKKDGEGSSFGLIMRYV